jgi:hypothetical protein
VVPVITHFKLNPIPSQPKIAVIFRKQNQNRNCFVQINQMFLQSNPTQSHGPIRFGPALFVATPPEGWAAPATINGISPAKRSDKNMI